MTPKESNAANRIFPSLESYNLSSEKQAAFADPHSYTSPFPSTPIIQLFFLFLLLSILRKNKSNFFSLFSLKKHVFISFS